MKPHLPIILLSALLGTFTTQAVEIPDDYEQIDLWTPSYLDDYTTNTADDKNAFILWTDVAFTPTTNPTWTSSKPLVTGGNLIFTTAEGYDPVAISFSGGASSVFKQPVSLTFDTLSNLTITTQTGSTDGAAIDLDLFGTLSIRNVNDGIDNLNKADVLFSGNKVTSSYGGGIYNGKSINIENNGYVKFNENVVGSDVQQTAYISGNRVSSGGAINTRSIQFISNEIIEFSSNKTLRNMAGGYNTTTISVHTMGGAIHISQESSFDDNTKIIFNDNLAESCASQSDSKAHGGAIHSEAKLNFNKNDFITFENNKVCARVSNTDVSTYAYGGAIYSTSTLNITESTDVTFYNNSTLAETIYNYYSSPKVDSAGGAIYSEGYLNIGNNHSVNFSNNKTSNQSISSCSKGGAIYSVGTINIVGNDSVVFEKNYENNSSSYHPYHLRSIYMKPDSSGDNLVLAAKTGGHIYFYDSVYMGNYSGSTVSINADYQDADGVTQKAGGDIIFSGQYTAEHLAEVKGTAATSSEITESQTSEINNLITLYGGSLQVVDGAKLNGRGLTVAAGSGAKLLLRDGSMSHSSYGFTFNSGTTLELQGHNTITASKVTLGSGSALTVTVGENNLSKEALTLGGTDLATSKLTVNLNRTDGLTSGMYKIISQSSASDFTTKSAWTAENVTVNGSGHANRAIFGDLVWKDGTLYYNVGRTIWGNASGDRLWNTSSDNWTMNDRSYTYLDGMDVTFTNLGAGDVKLVGDIAPTGIIVNNSEGNDYTFTAADGGGRLVGATGITKNGTGALTLNTANTHTGATVLNAGTLNVHHSNALGATATATTATVTTAVGTTLTVDNKSHVILAAENDMKGAVSVAEGSTLEMRSKGYAAESSRVDGTLHFKSDAAATANAGTLSGTGTVKVENSGASFTMLKSFTGNMAVEGAASRLNIGSGNYSAAGKISVTGASATLNMSSSNITMRSGGSLALSSDGAAAVLQGNNITITAGAMLSVENLTAPSVGSGEETPITLSTGTGSFDPTVAFNTTQSGKIESKLLTLQQGSSYEALGGNISMNGGQLTLAITPVATQKIELILTLAAGYTEDSQVVLFSDVSTVNFIFDSTTAKASDNLVYEFNADDYFEGDWINEATKLKYDAANKVVYVENVNDVIPEPTTTTLSLLALAALAARRRRK